MRVFTTFCWVISYFYLQCKSEPNLGLLPKCEIKFAVAIAFSAKAAAEILAEVLDMPLLNYLFVSRMRVGLSHLAGFKDHVGSALEST